MTEPQQGASYDQLRVVAQCAEEEGFDAFFRSDHYLEMGDVDGRPGPTDAWITLAGLARDTSRIRLGTLVTSATFRLPGPLAISVAQVDAMSGGRVELGLGAGRGPQDMRFSSAVVVCCGADEGEIRTRAMAIGREVDELRTNGVCGTPREVADRLGEWAEAGASTAYLQFLDLSDLDHLRLIAREVAPLVG